MLNLFLARAGHQSHLKRNSVTRSKRKQRRERGPKVRRLGEGPEEGKEWRKRADEEGEVDYRKKRTLTASEASETTGQATKLCPYFVRREVPQGKATSRWVGATPPYLHHFPRPEIAAPAQRAEGPRAERPSLHAPGPPPGTPPPSPASTPNLQGPISRPISGPAPAPASASGSGSRPLQPRPQAPARPDPRPRPQAPAPRCPPGLTCCPG